MEDSSGFCVPIDQDIEENSNVQLDQAFRNMLAEMRPIILTLPKELSTNCMSWLRLLTNGKPNEREPRNAIVQEMRRQLLDGAVRRPFSDPPPARLRRGLPPTPPVRAMARSSSRERDDSSKWSDISSRRATSVTVSAWGSANNGIGDASTSRTQWSNDLMRVESMTTSVYAESVTSSSFTDHPQSVRCSSERYLSPPSQSAMVALKEYQCKIQQLREELIEEKSGANRRVNALNQEVWALTNKNEEMEKSCATLERSHRQSTEQLTLNSVSILGKLSRQVSRAQEMSRVFHEALQGVDERVAEMEREEKAVTQPRGPKEEYLKLHKDIQLIRAEFEDHAETRERQLREKYGRLKEVIREFVNTKRMWAATYERRIELAECTMRFEIEEMQLQTMAEKQEMAAAVAAVEVSKLEEKYTVLLEGREAASFKRNQEHLKEISDLKQKLKKAGYCEVPTSPAK